MDKDFLEILACPNCRGDLTESEDSNSLICSECSAAYPVVEGIPVLLSSAAVMPEDADGV